MSDKKVTVQQVIQAIGGGRLFWIDSALNQSQIGPKCPYLYGALYLYLFNFKLLDSIKPFIDDSAVAQLNTVLCRSPLDSGNATLHEEKSRMLPSDQDSNECEFCEPSTDGQKLFLVMLDEFENAFHLLSHGSKFFTQEEESAPVLSRYFALRLKLYLNLAAPEDLPVADKLAGRSEGFVFCALAFHLLRKNDQYLTAKVDSLHQAFRLNGHITWLHMLIAKNDNHLERAKANWLNASYLPSFDHNLSEERCLMFTECNGLAGLSGIRLLRNNLQYRIDPGSVDDTLLHSEELDNTRECLMFRKRGERENFERLVKTEIVRHRNKKSYENVSANNASYVSPEDFLRTFVFTFPSVDAFKISLALSGILKQSYVFENLANLVSLSISKLDSRWVKTRDLQIVNDHAEFIRRIWRNYELGVYQIPPFQPVFSIYSDLEHWDFIRQIWPKARRILVVPSGNTDGLANDLALNLDVETDIVALDKVYDLRLLSRRLSLTSKHFRRCRGRWPGWHRLFLPGL